MLLVAGSILSEDEKAALSDAVASGWIAMADRVRDFERASTEQDGAGDDVDPAHRQRGSGGACGPAPHGRTERGPAAYHFVVTRLTGGDVARHQMEFIT